LDNDWDIDKAGRSIGFQRSAEGIERERGFLNPMLKSLFTMLCWFGSQKILDAIKTWGRGMGYDADKSLRIGESEKVPVLA
jgi:hypothetical protein